MAELEGAVGVGASGVANVPRRVEVVVVDGQVADVMGETDGEFARGVVVAEEDVRESIAALFGGVELLNQG